MDVVCGVDFSKHSARAIRYGAALARRVNGSLIVVFVNDPLLDAATSVVHDARAMSDRNERELQRFVRRVLGTAPASEVDRLIVVGEPARELHRIARDRGCGFIVVGTQGLRGSRHLFFGSTTEQLLRTTNIPVLAIPPRASAPPPNWPKPLIGCAVDLDVHLRADVQSAAQLAAMVGTKLMLVHAVKAASLPPWIVKQRIADPRLRSAETELASAAGDPDVAPAPEVRVVSGDPAEAIATFAARRLRLIVLRLRRGAGLFGSRPGTITYKLLTISTVPVLALPTREELP
jgi:nucleotide-binding universal stress UspA family protein